MSWELVQEVLLADFWQFSQPVDGSFFRITSINPPPLARMTVAQANQTGLQTELYGAVKLSSPVGHILQFQRPPFWTERKIAVRKNPRISAWRIRLEVSTLPTLPPSPTDSPTLLLAPPYPAAAALSALRVVRLTGGQLAYANSSEPNHAFSVLGLLREAIAPGETASPLMEGIFADASWDWQPDSPIFLGLQGQLTQSPQATGFILQVATPISSNVIQFQIQEPILL